MYSHLSIVQHRQRCIMQMHSSFNHIKVHVSLKKDSRGSKTSSMYFLWPFCLLCDTDYNRLCIETIRQSWLILLVGVGRVVRRCWVNFQCRGVLLIWIIVGQGPITLAIGAGGGCLDIFSLNYHFSFLSPSLWETVRYRLKYCHKGPLNPEQPTNHSTRKICQPASITLPWYIKGFHSYCWHVHRFKGYW